MQLINVVGLGVYRHVAATMDATFVGTPYRMAAILDLKGEPEAFRYNEHNLGVVLHTIQPRPQVFVTGAAITQAMTQESIAVWKEYVRKLGTKNTLVINVSCALQEGLCLMRLVLMVVCSCRKNRPRTEIGL